ncbi:MAG: GxxExxY protein [Planctomycetaceae bacterium]
MLIYEELTEQVIGAAMEVHKELGPGLLESAYQVCMCHELSLRRIPFLPKVELPVTYKDCKLDAGYEIDILVDRKIVLELKAVMAIHPVFEAQLLTYMRLSRTPVGLLINFHVPVLKDGIKRRVLSSLL